ncbi:MAG: cyclic nucleotide-binding domain-containing protein, partial [Gaiellaceae bacterium]
SWRRLSRIAPAAGPVGAPALLRSVPIFAPLPAATIERLASAVTQVRLVPGEQVFAEGDPGDRFYVIAAGEVQVVVAGRPARALGPGESFGEIALLRDVPRTATVTASSETEALALEREDFIAVVTGHPASAAAANSVIAARLGALRPSAGLL